MAVVDRLYAGYGEMADICDLHGFRPCAGPISDLCARLGQPYLRAEFPDLDYIETARLL